ncbi:Hypothetical protein D9617_47g010620 [Elsinoe fawcettii]|nr:Hypothetical protein D9617_47g010620 [Elsinoe fawcettii]
MDHFDPKGAVVMTDFWDGYILPNGTKELLSQVGNSGWEDSMELLSNVSWSPSLPSRFYNRWGYRLEKYLPLIVFGNNNINLQSGQPGAIQSVLDTEDQGSGYVNDYRVALAEGYQEFLKVFTNWTRSSLDLQYSSQTSYNLPMDMEASIPYDDVPECESLQFRDNVDSYRQFSGVAHLAGKNGVSIELGAVFGDAFIFTIPDLLFAMNRAAAGGVNQYIIHGQAYTGNYTGTTWPEYAGTGKIDVAFYNRQSATDPIVHTLYTPSDLQTEGWTYAYLSPDNFNPTQAIVRDGVMAPDGPAFKALIVESTQNMTLEGAAYLADYASSGLPIIISGGNPGIYASGDLNDRVSTEAALGRLLNTTNVYSVEPGQDTVKCIDYAYLFSDTNATLGRIIVQSTKKPYYMDLWTGEIKPIVVYTVQGNTTTIPINLAGNQTAVIGFSNHALDRCEPAPEVHIASLTADIIGYTYDKDQGIRLHIPSGSSGVASLSSGREVSIRGTDVPPAPPLTIWTLTAEHWAAPENINDASVVARKFSTTHQLNSLQSWLDIPELASVSGIGYYSTTFDWPPPGSQDASCHGAYITFSKILNALRVYVNGQRLPPLDYNNAVADISPYLRTGSNEILAVVPTTMWDYLQTILPQIRNAGVTPSFTGGPFGSASPLTDNALVGTASIVPFKRVVIPVR